MRASSAEKFNTGGTSKEESPTSSSVLGKSGEHAKTPVE
jgi:hypothetical protein